MANFRALKQVEHRMISWSAKGYSYMLVHQGEIEIELENCNTILFDSFLFFIVRIVCFNESYASLTEFQTAAQIELLAYVREDQKVLNESQFTESQNDSDLRAISTMMQAVRWIQIITTSLT